VSIQRKKIFQWNRIVRVLALAGVFAITVGKGSAQSLSDDSGNGLNLEYVNGNPLTMQMNTGYNEARINGVLMEVWEGATNQNVWMSINNGLPFTFSEALTNNTPTVIPYGSDQFMVFFTGTDNHIWYSFVGTDGSNPGRWYQVPNNQTTGMPVAAAPMGGPGTTNVFVAYHGNTTDNIYQTWYDGSSGTWSDAEDLGRGVSPSHPAVTYNIATNQMVVAIQGTNNHLLINSQALGAQGWGIWQDEGLLCLGPPALVSIPSGRMVTEAPSGAEGALELALYNSAGDIIQTLTDESAQGASVNNLTTEGDQVFGLYQEGVTGDWQQVL
jgi:hypothetical protein